MEAGFSEFRQPDLSLPASQARSAVWGAQQRQSLHLQGQTKTKARPPKGNPFTCYSAHPLGREKDGELRDLGSSGSPRGCLRWGWGDTGLVGGVGRNAGLGPSPQSPPHTGLSPHHF